MKERKTLDIGGRDRRHFYRIDDEVILHFRQIRGQSGGGDDKVLDEPSQAFLVFFRLTEQREHVRGLLRELRSESHKISRCLNAMDERIGLLETVLMLDQIGAFAGLRRAVKLSAGGLAFRTGVPYSRDVTLLLEMILLPTLTGIVAHGQVVRSVRQLGRDGEPPFLTTIEFTEMKESTRDLIARHVLARQSQRLQRRCD